MISENDKPGNPLYRSVPAIASYRKRLRKQLRKLYCELSPPAVQFTIDKWNVQDQQILENERARSAER